MVSIYLIRHAESEGNARGIHQGQRHDFGLSKKGIEQAKAIAKRLEGERFSAIYSSDLKRAAETADIIAKKHKLKVIRDKRLRELDAGDLTDNPDKWKIWDEMRAKDKKTPWEEVKLPNGESDADLKRRVKSFLEEVSKIDGKIVVVAHGGPNHVLLHIFSHNTWKEELENPKQKNSCLNVLEKDGDEYKIHLVNCIKHYESAKE